MKRVGLFFLLILFSVFFYAPKVSAQATPGLASQSWKCLRGDSQGFTFTSVASTTLSQNLYADGFPLGSELYVVTCIGSQEGGICTTGNPAYDQIIFNNDNTKIFPYAVTIKNGSKQMTNLGKITTSATITTAGLSGGLVFYGVLVGDIQNNLGSGPGEKQGVFSFGDNVTTKCVSISWNTVFPPHPALSECHASRENEATDFCRKYDPLGIVFDSKSLEPMPNIVVTILDKDKKKYNLVGLTNPQMTKADGLFNFLVEPGVYYLSINPALNHTFTATPNLDANFIKIYHKLDGSNSIYKPDEPVAEIIDTPAEVEQGYPNMEHRDIPLDPGTSAPYIVAPSTVSYSVFKADNDTQVNGKVSHPFTTVTFMQGTKEIFKTQADRFGYFTATLADSLLQQDIDVSVVYTKADLTNHNLLFEVKKILPNFLSNIFTNLLSKILVPLYAQSDIRILSSVRGFSFSPSFSQIQGYAYDKNNTVAPSSKVNLKLDMNKATFYETTTDQNGYFSIPKENMPIYPYHIEVASQKGTTVSYSPTDFAKKNKDYLTKNKVNLIASASAPDKLTRVDINGSANPANSPLPTKSMSAGNAFQSKTSALIVTIVVIILCLIAAGAMVFFMIKGKKSY